jgi:hypothetical protein
MKNKKKIYCKDCVFMKYEKYDEDRCTSCIKHIVIDTPLEPYEREIMWDYSKYNADNNCPYFIEK